MKDSTLEAIAYLIVTLFLILPFTSFVTMSTWNDVLVPLTYIKSITFWQAVQVAVSLGLTSSLYSSKS